MSGATEEAFFFGPPGARRFGFLHRPAGRATAGVVVCPPNEAEAMRHYRKEFLLGRALAARGIAALRFHYSGEGNSDGSGSGTTAAHMIEDAGAAAEQLRTLTGVDRLAFLGARWGAIPAAAASRGTGAPLVLWEPVAEGRAYFREVLRWRLMRELRLSNGNGNGSRPTTDSLLERMRQDGFIDVVGYPLWASLYESGIERSLLEEVGPEPRNVLLVQLALDRELRSDHARLVAALRERGSDVRTALVHDEIVWRFQVNWATQHRSWSPEERRAETSELIDVTVAWLVDELGARGEP